MLRAVAQPSEGRSAYNLRATPARALLLLNPDSAAARSSGRPRGPGLVASLGESFKFLQVGAMHWHFESKAFLA
jgi:hypothetical protein